MHQLKHLLHIILILTIGCNSKQKEFRYNLKVVDDKDSLNNFDIFTDLHEDYSFHNNQEIDSIFCSKASLDMVDGEFMLGFTNDKHYGNKLLVFKSTNAKFPDGDIEIHKKVLFFEFCNVIQPNQSVRLNPISDHKDTLSDNRSRQISCAITDALSLDTIGFQENVYVLDNDKLLTTILIYTDISFRNELLDFSHDLFNSKKWKKN